MDMADMTISVTLPEEIITVINRNNFMSLISFSVLSYEYGMLRLYNVVMNSSHWWVCLSVCLPICPPFSLNTRP